MFVGQTDQFDEYKNFFVVGWIVCQTCADPESFVRCVES